MSNTNDNYMAVLLEQIRDEVRSVHEAVVDAPTRGEFIELRHDVAELKQDTHVLKAAVADLSQDLKVIKAAVSDNGRELVDYGQRIAKLEAV